MPVSSRLGTQLDKVSGYIISTPKEDRWGFLAKLARIHGLKGVVRLWTGSHVNRIRVGQLPRRGDSCCTHLIRHAGTGIHAKLSTVPLLVQPSLA
jgi:hypothetical protein